MTSRIHLTLLVFWVALAAGGPAAAASNPPLPDAKRLVVMPLVRAEGVNDPTWRTVWDAVQAEAAFSAKKRGYTIVPLRKVAGLEKQANGCADLPCRQEVYRRAGATHGLTSRVEVDGTGYKVLLELELAETGEVVGSAETSGRLFLLAGKIPEATTTVLEEGSPKDSVARQRLTQTATAYEKAGRYKDAARTYRRAIALNPFHADAARLMLAVVQVWERADDWAEADAAGAELVASYGAQSPWARAGIGGEKIQSEVAAGVGAWLRRAGEHHHHLALALPKDDAAKAAARRQLLEKAVGYYRQYVELYPEGPERGEVSFLFGEVAFELGLADDAAAQYEVARDKAAPDRQQLAAEGACFALEALLAKAGLFDPQQSYRVRNSPQRLPPLVTRYVDAGEQLFTRFPESENGREFLLRAARAELKYGHKAEATAHLGLLVEKAPGSKAALDAASLMKKL